MSVSLRRSGALFLHIPKTGGTWVETTLEQIGIETEQAETIEGVTFRHAPPPMIRNKYRFTFTFVRHPLSWYESWWKFQAGLWRVFEPGVWHPQRVLERCQSDDFSEFIRLMVEREPGYVSRMYEWFIGPPGRDYAQFVGRQENLADDLIDVLTRLGYGVDAAAIHGISRANESEQRRGQPVWDPALRRKVLELEAAAIRRFYADMPEPLPRTVCGSPAAVEWTDSLPGSGSALDGIGRPETPIPPGIGLRIAVSHPGAGEQAGESSRVGRREPRRPLATAGGPIGRARANIARRIVLSLRGR